MARIVAVSSCVYKKEVSTTWDSWFILSEQILNKEKNSNRTLMVFRDDFKVHEF